jgi:hypothetical protein
MHARQQRLRRRGLLGSEPPDRLGRRRQGLRARQHVVVESADARGLQREPRADFLLRDLRASLFERALGLLAAVDVDEEASEARELPARTVNRLPARERPLVRTVAAAQAQLALERGARVRQVRVAQRSGARAVVGMDELEDPHARHRFARRRIAEQLEATLGEQEAVACEIPLPDAVAGRRQREQRVGAKLAFLAGVVKLATPREQLAERNTARLALTSAACRQCLARSSHGNLPC